MTEMDLPVVSAIADAIHLDHHEDAGVFYERLELYPDGCHVLAWGGTIVGYVIGHPWNGDPPKLNTMLGALPSTCSTYYVHDIALLPVVRGLGHARAIVDTIEFDALHNGYSLIDLVAVSQSQAFWDRLGFGIVGEADGYAGGIAMRKSLLVTV